MSKIKEPISALTHMSFAVIAVPLMVILLVFRGNTPLQIAGFVIFGMTMLLLYSASGIYHSVRAGERATRVLKKIDHMMIFVFIAGTYTPICLIALKGTVGLVLLCVIWGIALGGVFLKLFWIGAPRILATAIYVAMGWVVVFAFYPLTKAVDTAALALLIGGGAFYTVGAVLYAVKPKFLVGKLGFHEIFHVFVMLGTACHYAMMFSL